VLRHCLNTHVSSLIWNLIDLGLFLQNFQQIHFYKYNFTYIVSYTTTSGIILYNFPGLVPHIIPGLVPHIIPGLVPLNHSPEESEY